MLFDDDRRADKKIVVCADGPYEVIGPIPLVLKTQVVSECGEPLAWRKDGEISTADSYSLCRCGHSAIMPLCDGSHHEIHFDGSETAPTNLTVERRTPYPGGKKIIIHFDHQLCSDSGFCGNRARKISEMAANSDEIQVRIQLIGMIEHCPSGALTYRFEGVDTDNEVDLPQQIAVTTEITSEGPIRGPLWVTGNILILRADEQPFERRNRVTLCNCGRSHSKPLCDGSHRIYPTRK